MAPFIAFVLLLGLLMLFGFVAGSGIDTRPSRGGDDGR
jgi:hypothetical protein